ncbi:MAG: hypothetical protein DI538_10790 [Azospira oryzae]|nr:MAG: hypothetical protein DI538_10790 [Azospira oryzae]
MKFSSIKEYFYRLQSRCYALLLLPLVLLITQYLFQRFAHLNLVLLDEEIVFYLKIIVPFVAVLELTSVHLVVYLKLKSIRQMKGMGDRLDRYASLATLKMSIGVSSSVIVLVGFMLTAEEWFIGFFMICLLYILLQRPTPKRLSGQLQLKGDERELILKGELV